MRKNARGLTWTVTGIVAVLAVCACAAGPATRAGPATQLSVTLDAKSLPISPGYHVIKAQVRTGGKEWTFASGIFLPPAYFQHDELFPMVMTLHNRGDSGSDGGKGMIYEGLGLLMANDHPETRGTGDKPRNAINLRTDAQFIGLVPQCPAGYGWEKPPVAAILDEFITQIAKAYHGDPDRVYLTGFSYGGSSTWQVALQIPGRFAAIAPLDGRATHDPPHDVATLQDVGIYIGIGGDDGEFIPESQRMREALISAKHRRFIYHVVPHGNHWNYACVYDDADFWEWMFSQRRPGAVAAARPSTLPAFGAATTQSSSPGPVVEAAPSKKATVLCQYWRDLPGTHIKDLADDPGFPRYPAQQEYLNQMEIPPNQEAGYGTVLRAIVHPPLTGDYLFYIASDNQGELWLSSDSKSEHLVKIAAVPEWTLPRGWGRDPNQQSKPIHLASDKTYLIEARHKSGGGDNHLSVAWKWPDGTFEGPISAAHLDAPPSMPVEQPKVIEIHARELPIQEGTYRLKLDVDCLGHRQSVGMVLILPRNFERGKCPAMVYCADSEAAADGEGFRMTGPAGELSKRGSPLVEGMQLVVIAPQVPTGGTYEKVWAQRCVAAAVEKMLKDLSVDPQRIYLTGSGSGGTLCWHLAMLMPGRFAAVAPICGLQVQDAELVPSLKGTAVRIITGCLNGRATDCANRMKEDLSKLDPAVEIVYELKMGSDVAQTYYAKAEFYQWLLSWRRVEGRGVRDAIR